MLVPENTVVNVVPSVEVDMTKLFVRDAPLYQATSREVTVFADPRFAVINDPTPRLDHLVPKVAVKRV